MSEKAGVSFRGFLSYSHADKNWANWIHRRLENFAIDRDLVGRVTPIGVAPENLRYIFRDRSDFASGRRLSSATIEAIDASAALLVVCSPRAADSEYVNQEVLLFRSRHPTRPVVPVIVDGAYPGNFPPALRFEIDGDGNVTDTPVTFIASDLREESDGRLLGLAKVVAGMTGLAPDEVFRRAERSRNHERRKWMAGAAVVAAVILALGVWAEIQRIRMINFMQLATSFSTFQVRDDTNGWQAPTTLANNTLNSMQEMVSRLRGFGGVKILWFDSKPALSRHAKMKFRDGMKNIGISLREESDIERAKEAVGLFDVVIANYGSPKERFAYQLLAVINNRNLDTPLVVYGLEPNPNFAREAICYGAVSRATEISELFSAVVRAVAKGRVELSDETRRRCIEGKIKPFHTPEWRRWLDGMGSIDQTAPPSLAWE